MVKFIYFFIILYFIYSCDPILYNIDKDIYGEPILNEKARYSFTEKPSNKDLLKIDTTAYYIEVSKYNNHVENPLILNFHNDGYFKRNSLKYYGNFDKKRHKNSVHYGGKYKIINSEIFFESFLPASSLNKRYIKKIVKGKLEENGKILLIDYGDYIKCFEKIYKLPEN